MRLSIQSNQADLVPTAERHHLHHQYENMPWFGHHHITYLPPHPHPCPHHRQHAAPHGTIVLRPSTASNLPIPQRPTRETLSLHHHLHPVIDKHAIAPTYHQSPPPIRKGLVVNTLPFLVLINIVEAQMHLLCHRHRGLKRTYLQTPILRIAIVAAATRTSWLTSVLSNKKSMLYEINLNSDREASHESLLYAFTQWN
jgi:hypothetical protein